MPLLDTRQKKDLLGTFINDLILQLLSYVAQTEKEKINTRQREGIDIALKYGTKTGNSFGRPKITKPDNFEEVIKGWKDKKITAREAMKKLNDKEKMILGKRFFEGRTQIEVADEIGISQAQVSRLEKNAIEHIKKMYK